MNKLRYWYHALLCLPSFKVKHGDGTMSHKMSYDCARDYIDEEPGSAETIVFEP